MKQKLVSLKNRIVERKIEILVTVLVVTTTVAVLEQIGIRSLNDFLKEHNLYETYYLINEEN